MHTALRANHGNMTCVDRASITEKALGLLQCSLEICPHLHPLAAMVVGLLLVLEGKLVKFSFPKTLPVAVKTLLSLQRLNIRGTNCREAKRQLQTCSPPRVLAATGLQGAAMAGSRISNAVLVLTVAALAIAALTALASLQHGAVSLLQVATESLSSAVQHHSLRHCSPFNAAANSLSPMSFSLASPRLPILLPTSSLTRRLSRARHHTSQRGRRRRERSCLPRAPLLTQI